MDALRLYRALDRRGAFPALTWYSPEGRVELSGRVAANHLAKVAGYLLEDVWIEPGAAVILDCRPGFKQVLWGLGSLLAGAHVTVADPPGRGLATATGDAPSGMPAAVNGASGRELAAVVTDAPERWVDAMASGVEVLAVAPAPLAMQWIGEPLPPGARDASAEVMGASDTLVDETAHENSNWSVWESVEGADGGHRDDQAISAQDDQASDAYPDQESSTHPHQESSTHPDQESSTHPDQAASEASAQLLVAPSAAQALAAAVRSLAAVRLIVVENPEEAERIRIAENIDEVRH